MNLFDKIRAAFEDADYNCEVVNKKDDVLCVLAGGSRIVKSLEFMVTPTELNIVDCATEICRVKLHNRVEIVANNPEEFRFNRDGSVRLLYDRNGVKAHIIHKARPNSAGQKILLGFNLN